MLILFIAGIIVICLFAFLCLALGKPKVNYFDEGDPRNNISRVDKSGKIIWMDDFERMAYYEND